MPDSTSPCPLLQRPLGDIVKGDARAAAVLEGFGLDYCCSGQQTLEEAAAARQVPVARVIVALESLGAPAAGDEREQWTELDSLTRHICERHHRYIRDVTPAIAAWLDKLVDRHGAKHPELIEIRAVFGELAGDMATHMTKEENLLFPCIDDLAVARRTGAPRPLSPFGTVLNPMRVMEADHRAAGDLLDRLRALTGGYTPPADACATFRLCYSELARFEADLHRHVHLENNVLFPQALELERELT